MRQHMCRALMAAVLVVAVGLVGSPALAEPGQHGDVTGLNTVDIGAAETHSEPPADVPDGADVVEFGSGSTLVLVPGSAVSGPRTRMSVGVGRTIYLYLSRNEQSVLAAGGGAGIAALACVTGGAGVCVVASAAIAAATMWVSQNGFCPKRLEIAVGRGYTCVS
ncbi:MAG TPA: hypothetical protein VGC57_06285 [Cellulomonas sp.]